MKKTVIEVTDVNFQRSEWSSDNKLITRRRYDIKDLGESMKNLAHSTSTQEEEEVLKALRFCYKKLGARKFTFERDDEVVDQEENQDDFFQER